ncbi:MAG: glycosyltransferase family 2 protein [Ardenticatenaceae bacterium]|nr:glycosyltransferase family 2 protein [Ardenticatenaceae bacterium]
MKLSIVIVSWNTKTLLAGCLDSVFANPPGCDFDVWVVDNASTDDSVQMVRQQFPQVELIVNQENIGFAPANNQAIERCNGRYVLLLNPDTEVLPGGLAELVEFMDSHPDTGAAGSRLLNPDHSLQPSCYPMLTLGRELWRLFHLDILLPYAQYRMYSWDVEQPQRVEVIQGASFLVRREALEQIGLLDEAYFMYTEEVDLCYRLQKAGWQLFWIPRSKVIHFGGQSTQQVATNMFLQLYKSKIQFFRKHYGRFAAGAYKFILMAASLARLSLSPLAWLRRGPARARRLTLAHNYRLLLGALPAM